MRLTLSAFLIICVAGIASAEPISDAKLNELRTDAQRMPPKQQTDLDTRQLASAQRERAATVQDKTEGLWQSWLVSICEGCSPRQRRPAEIETAADAYKPTNKAVLPYSQTSAETILNQRVSRSAAARNRGTLYSDLSSQNVSQIRMMPNR